MRHPAEPLSYSPGGQPLSLGPERQLTFGQKPFCEALGEGGGVRKFYISDEGTVW